MVHRKGHHMMHEDHGSHHEHLRAEHERHGHRLHHEHEIHNMSHSLYKHEEDRPKQPKEGHLEHGSGCNDFKKEADPIAYGQAAGPLVGKDMHRIESQFKDYHWD